MGNRLHNTTLLVGAALVPLTIVAIYLVYGASLFDKWPWLRFSMALAMMTCLWAYACNFIPATKGSKAEGPLLFAVIMVVVPLDSLLLYPGTEVLGLFSDSKFLRLIIVLDIIHGVGFFLIQRAFNEYASPN